MSEDKNMSKGKLRRLIDDKSHGRPKCDYVYGVALMPYEIFKIIDEAEREFLVLKNKAAADTSDVGSWFTKWFQS